MLYGRDLQLIRTAIKVWHFICEKKTVSYQPALRIKSHCYEACVIGGLHEAKKVK